tara:strand:+ start:4588 stop:4866 length:279 start_codon:yes stop_codon:yes gene_type:complete
MRDQISNEQHRKWRIERFKCLKAKIFWCRVILCSLIAALVFFLMDKPFATIGCLLANFIFLGLHQQAKMRMLEIKLLKSKIYNSILMDRANG